MADKNNKTIRFSSFFDPSLVICQTDQTDRDIIIKDLLRLLAYERGIGNVEEVYQAVMARENEIPTIVGPFMAMPHARLDTIDNIVVGIATSKKGINYTPSDTKPIKLIILTLAPKTAPGIYLQAISSLAKICLDPNTANTIAELTSPDDIWKFFDRGGMVLPDYVKTSDIMDPIKVALQENDTLEQAIDLFVQHGLIDLPVVDKDGELIGVVTTYELLKVCLPDYILWMDDLTPILNFEPFAEILRKESKTWLADIMTNEYVTVSEDAPAIQVAKEITRQRVDNAYVVRGKKLVGMVSLGKFLSKVLRE